ncbi:type I-C CRISPR-associated protein Cas8c/Csd1 [Desulfurivibrio sp. C05AmB]|uniref:type I-C CRISPR-associated protein Cas8c/Csd1 n=1 Tax=Desulfurivibrio sp. C05AmB TaxID=3374371 RepID=UPI00376F2B7B
MIIKALADYYERMLNDPNCDVAPPGFEKKAIPFLLVLGKDGRLVNIRDTRTGEGKKKTAREFVVPHGEKKTYGIKANLLWDNPQYLFGVSKSGSAKDLERAAESFSQFTKRIEETFPVDGVDTGIMAVKKFLIEKDFTKVFAHEYWPEIEETKANLTFILEGDNHLVAQSPEVVKRIRERDGAANGVGQVCAVSGQVEQSAELHPSIKGVWGAQSSGANIVSFNLDSFRSFGKKQGLNAPIGHTTTFAYTTALNTLLAKGSRQRIQVGDASTVFWADEAHPFEHDFSAFLGEPQKGEEPDYGRIRSLLSAVRSGVLPPEDNTPFYVLGLAPNASRIAVRFWYEGNVRDLKEKIARHFEDIEIVRSPRDREYISLFQLLVATATEGKADNIPPNLGGEIARAVLVGASYPRTLLSGAVRRFKAEQRITRARAAIIKGFLVRESRLRGTTTKEVGEMLDTKNENIGYVLGRMFAVLERIQEQANTSLNKTIRDTYFSAATSSPLVIFKRLQELAVHHLAKIRNSGKSTVWLEKLMGEIMGKVPAVGIPATLSLEDQGRFAVGYYHQRQDFFKSNKEEGKGE